MHAISLGGVERKGITVGGLRAAAAHWLMFATLRWFSPTMRAPPATF
jgi:hypothetical protein